MSKNAFYAFVALTCMWVILVESFSWLSIGTGAVVSAVCVLFCRKIIPLEPVRDVRFSRLWFYPLYLIGEIYVQGFFVIKMILSGVRVDIVDANTKLKSDFLRAILVSSVVLTPGSVPLGLEGEKLKVLNLGSASDEDAYQVVDALRARLEKQLTKAQK